MRNIVSIVLIINVLIGCSAAGVIYTNDPYEKVRNAEGLTSRNRSLPARRFLLEVMDEINASKEKDEKLIGYTYRALGFLLTSSTYQSYRSNRDDYTTPYDGDREKGLEYYDRAFDIFVKKELYYDASNTTWMKHLVYKKLELNDEACVQLDKTIEYNELGLNSDKKNGKGVAFTGDHSSFDEQLSKRKTKLNCKLE